LSHTRVRAAAPVPASPILARVRSEPPPDPAEDSASRAGDVTRCLASVAAGEPAAADELLGLLYSELHRAASAAMHRERSDHTLQPTALVHEVWLRVLSEGERTYQDRAHFLRCASLAMRRVLVDHARRRASGRAEVPGRRAALEDWLVVVEARQLDLVALDEALATLEAADSDLARLVELRFFGGLTIAEVAELTGRSTASLERDWRIARALLERCLEGGGPR
jgi:RNA polymerase sigma-70 factor (ECF subfamily)